MSHLESAGSRPTEIFGHWRRLRGALTTSPGWLAALVALPLAAILVAEYTAAPAVPQPAQTGVQQLRIVPEAQQPPIGTWTCALAGTAVGTLTVTGWHYELATADGITGDGDFEPIGGRAGKNRATYLKITSGPLKDDLGIRLGLHDEFAEPDTLIFNLKPGTGLHCIPW